ncbi:MAG: DUF6531 domain-containing protein, partial [Verrucomicrobiae bacterium]|nr:DUF6531 domain-containing protein [Verrucomicrobiae bacterium]
MRQTLLLPLRFHTVVLVFAFVLLGIAALQLCPERAVAGGSTVTNVNLSASLHDSLLRLRVTGEVQPGAIYIFETAGAVSTNPPWSLLEPVQATNNFITYDLIRPSDQATAFFRVRLPQPTIFRVEPAIAPTTGGTDFFLIGQMLAPGGEVRIAGQTVTPDMIQEGTLYRCIAPALAEGVYDVEWLEGGQVVARLPRGFTVTAQPLPIAQRLAEPPTEPPASPEWGSINDLWTDLVNDCDVTPETPALYYKTRTKSNNANERVASGDYRTRTKSNNANERVAVGDLDGDGLVDAVGAGDLDFDTVRLLPATGEVEIQECDVLVPGVGLDFAFVRTYRSRSGRDTPMGRNWDHSYNLYIEAEGSHIAVCDGTGRRDVLFQQPDGSYARDEFFWRGRWDATNGNFILEFPGKGIWEFYHFGVHPAGGRIARIADANGNELQFTYNFAGRLTEITDTLGRTFTLSYNADGRLAQLADFTGRVWTYTYHTNGSPEGSAGDLARVTTPAVTNTPTGNDFPLGKTTRYTYTRGHPQPELNHNLETITDPKNQTWLRVTYHTNTSPTAPEFDTVAFLERGGHKTHLWRGSLAVHPSTRFAVVRAIVRDGVGNVCEFFCDSLNRPVIVREFTGRSNTNSPVTATGNRPTGKLRATDPDFYETAFEWNADSLLTRYIWPDGDEIRCAYERDFDPATNPRKKGDLRVWRFQPLAAGDLDADGITDDHTRVWRFEHDPRFGSPAYAFRAEAPDHAIKTKNANGSFRVAMPDHAIKTKNPEGGFRVTRVTDPRGIV